ncbi:tryptophan synthase beta subunit-like PLP-dependent enzyme [Kickxella alabastrina]|uniref:tryptophan synthase beta subunit-like PLP-dependent enzyme n=1 Tax=Kickxella alabastrina TaxID=61397 RepID=UPI002220C4C7|nr:tryptophan synthase beta subunit-like PLP-dependent enzyme [Kickxella alabastrina]KAI7823145.1 tryptophan synthase beta subunit-like PLP-dependent enzyme [Kickxella alabastrina]
MSRALQGIVDIVDTIGNTPMARLSSVEGLGAAVCSAELVGKLEYMNPGGSIKDRLDTQGTPKDALLVVASPGNLAISLAMLQRRLLCLVPERTSSDRIRLLKAAGITDIVRTLDGALPGSPEHPVQIGRRIVEQRGHGAVYIDEEQGQWDLASCYEELAAEMVAHDALVLGVDTGNAATHLARALRETTPGVQIVGVEPANSAIGEQAIRAIDMWMQVSDAVAYSMARRLITGGIHAGPAAGASVAAALVLLGDTARNYSDTLLSDEWMLTHDLLDARMLGDLQRRQLGQYRGASIEDLQLPAAVTVRAEDSIGAAVALMSENDFSQVPVTGAHRRLVGYLTLSAAQTLIDSGVASPSSPVSRFMLRFAGSDSAEKRGSNVRHRRYWLITPETPLSELARFFETHSVAFVTDASRKFCLGIATKQDLMSFLSRRNTFQF